jgi:hypothetical protein
MENIKQSNPNPGNISWSATMIDKVHKCADCPIRLLAVKQPKSIFARLHIWHMKWWPGWKAHQARTCPFSASVNNPAQ